MSYFKMGKYDVYKIFTSWDFSTYKSFNLTENTTCKELNDKLAIFHQTFSNSENTKNFSLFFILRDNKTKTIIFKRKLNYFECPLSIFQNVFKDLADESKFKEILFLSINSNEISNQEDETSQIFVNFNTFFMSKGNKKESSFERAGELQKMSKKGGFRKKFFELSKTQLIFYNPKEKEKNINFIPLENAISEPLNHSKEKYVFVIRTFDKTIYKEKNYILKAKSTMDMNGWVFSINSQAFMCTENKKIYDFGQDLLKNEKRNVELLQEKAFKAFSNFEDFLENPKIRDFFLKKSREKEFFQKKFRYLIDLLDLYFRSKISKNQSSVNEDSLVNLETLYKTLEAAYFNENKLQIEENKENCFYQDFPDDLSKILGLETLFEIKFDSFKNKNFIVSFENLTKPKILDNLKKSKEVSKILIEILSNLNSNFASFQKPDIMDLRHRKIKENSYLGVSKKNIKGVSQTDFLGIVVSPKNSINILSNPKSSVEINN